MKREQREQGEYCTRTGHEQAVERIVQEMRVGDGEQPDHLEVGGCDDRNEGHVSRDERGDRYRFRKQRPRRDPTARSEQDLEQRPQDEEVGLEREGASGEQSDREGSSLRYLPARQPSRRHQHVRNQEGQREVLAFPEIGLGQWEEHEGQCQKQQAPRPHLEQENTAEQHRRKPQRFPAAPP